MKRYLIHALLLTALITLGACNSGTVRNNKVASHGKAYEIIVVVTQDKWDGEMGDTLRNILLEPVEIINSREPIFDVMRIVPANFNGLITKHHNIINVNVGPDFTTPQMGVAYDLYAAPQAIVNITGPDQRSVIDYISEHRSELQTVFSMAERDRTVAQVERYGNKQLEKDILEKFGFGIKLPQGFRVRNQSEDFMWLSYEYPQASQGIVIYTYPYTDRNNFTVDSLLKHRDRFVSRVPGENPGSYMITYPEFVPEVNYMRVNGRFWAEMRGFWDVKGDFMGGPFMSYSTLDTQTNKVVTVDCYVYSPSPYKHKRNLVRQLEHFIYTVKFPGDAAILEQAE